MAGQWTDPDTGQVYDLTHLRPLNVTYELKDSNGELCPIRARIYFWAHCYTRTRKSEDPDCNVVVSEKRRDGTTEERVFCIDRWTFSQQLPEILRNLADKSCLQGSSQELFYRQESTNNADNHHGWYLCIRMRYNVNNEKNGKCPLELSVRSVHHRTNRPNNIRGNGTQRFKVLLKKLITRKS